MFNGQLKDHFTSNSGTDALQYRMYPSYSPIRPTHTIESRSLFLCVAVERVICNHTACPYHLGKVKPGNLYAEPYPAFAKCRTHTEAQHLSRTASRHTPMRSEPILAIMLYPPKYAEISMFHQSPGRIILPSAATAPPRVAPEHIERGILEHDTSSDNVNPQITVEMCKASEYSSKQPPYSVRHTADPE